MNKIDLDSILSKSFKTLKQKQHKISKKRRESSDDSDDPFIIPNNYKPKLEQKNLPDLKTQLLKNDKTREVYIQHIQELERQKQIDEYERKTGKRIITEKPKDEYVPKTFSALAPCPGFEEQRKRTLSQKINPNKFNAGDDNWDVPQKDRYKNYTKPTYTNDVGTTNYDAYQEKKYSATYEYWKDPNYVPPPVVVAKRKPKNNDW
jgi:hypothetical protein